MALIRFAPHGMLQIRPMQADSVDHDPRYTLVTISRSIKIQLGWWNDKEFLQLGIPIHQTKHDLVLYTNASNPGGEGI